MLEARKCTNCAGKLERTAEKNIWECPYCGTKYEFKDEYDGLHDIKNVVRQSLLETANSRLKEAGEHLLECEKINASYVGTLIARLAYDVTRCSSPGACEERERQALLDQIRRNAVKLRGLNRDDERELALYESFEDADIFALLVLVYDSMGDSARRDLVEKKLTVPQIYSKRMNFLLLRYALAEGKRTLADGILANRDNLEIKDALSELLAHYPDGEEKSVHAEALLAAGALRYEDRKLLENYLAATQDAEKTRGRVCAAGLRAGVPVPLKDLIDRIVKDADLETAGEVLRAYCAARISDEDVASILACAYGCRDPEKAACAMDCLRKSGQYVSVPAKLLQSMLSDGALRAADRLALLKKTFEFTVDRKTVWTVVKSYLFDNTDGAEERAAVLDCLLGQVDTIPTDTVNSYILDCTRDGSGKAAVAEKLFEKNLELSYYKSLLTDYLRRSKDAPEVKSAIVGLLCRKGLKADPAGLADYICGSGDGAADKLLYMGMVRKNGSQLLPDTASRYLESADEAHFSPELLSRLIVPGSAFSADAAENFLLCLRRPMDSRAENAAAILERAPEDTAEKRCEIAYLGSVLVCSLAQAYILTASDGLAAAQQIVSVLTGRRKAGLRTDVTVDGRREKLREYLAEHETELSEVTRSLCRQYGLMRRF